MIICCGQASSLRNSPKPILSSQKPPCSEQAPTQPPWRMLHRVDYLSCGISAVSSRTTGGRRIQYLYTGSITNCHVQFSNGN